MALASKPEAPPKQRARRQHGGSYYPDFGELWDWHHPDSINNHVYKA